MVAHISLYLLVAVALSFPQKSVAKTAPPETSIIRYLNPFGNLEYQAKCVGSEKTCSIKKYNRGSLVRSKQVTMSKVDEIIDRFFAAIPPSERVSADKEKDVPISAAATLSWHALNSKWKSAGFISKATTDKKLISALMFLESELSE